ncbi:MAG: DNA mismatch repair endonuclease MutL [Clostridiaceae bacterium]
MNKINILDQSTINKIAAGEVVERPFSVVKELVENSIDSNADNIIIEIEEGGEKLIKIIDNGTGILPEDLERAFLPHATSKINQIDDINRIQTMGFRGEALASIASVSKISMKSRAADFDIGKNITLDAGDIRKVEDIGTNIGTTVVVRELFFNMPARKKFLKSISREFSYISDIITRMALANPEISFKLIHNDKVTMNTFGTGNVVDVIRSVYGKSAAENIIKFEEHGDTASVYGFIGNAELAKGNRNCQSIFVNKRFIKNKMITAAVENAFKSFITVNKHPFFVLFINIYPEFIDVNVHPTKSEIKFMDEREIYRLVFHSVHTALRDSLRETFSLEMPGEGQEPLTGPAYILSEEISKIAEIPVLRETVQIPLDLKSEITSFEARSQKIPDIRIIGQFNKTYIIGEYGGELYLIDQHAAHEKILFERYTDEIRNHDVTVQLLLTPVVLELNNEEYQTYYDNAGLISSLGFKIEEFGQNTICIREVPLILGKPDIKGFFSEVIDNLHKFGSGDTAEVKYKAIASMACRFAVKARDSLSDIEMKNLIDELKFIDDPYTCPHGRPTIIKIGLTELEKRFKRIQ